MSPPSRATAGGSDTSVSSMVLRTSVRSSTSASRLRTSGACRSLRIVRNRGNSVNDWAEGHEVARAQRCRECATSRSRSWMALGQVPKLGAVGAVKRKVFHRVQAILDARQGDERSHEPCTNQTSAHRGRRAIDLVQQRACAAAIHTFHHIEVAQRDGIDQQCVSRQAPRDVSHMRQFHALRGAEIVHDGAGRRRRRRRVFKSEPRQ